MKGTLLHISVNRHCRLTTQFAMRIRLGNFCPCTCDTHDRLGQNPVSDPDPLANCPERYIDEENRCEYRLRSDPTMCSLTGALVYCPCTCGEPSSYPANPGPGR